MRRLILHHSTTSSNTTRTDMELQCTVMEPGQWSEGILSVGWIWVKTTARIPDCNTSFPCRIPDSGGTILTIGIFFEEKVDIPTIVSFFLLSTYLQDDMPFFLFSFQASSDQILPPCLAPTLLQTKDPSAKSLVRLLHNNHRVS